jgi:hypothetical protein
MGTLSIQSILEKVTGISKKSKEGTQRYLKRLAVAVDDKVSDRQFNKLPEKVQDWVNGAIDAIAAETDIPVFPDVTPEASASDINKPKNTEDADMKAAKKTKPTKKAVKTVKKTHLKVVKVAPVYKKSTLSKSVTSAVRQMTLMHPKLSKAEIGEKLVAAGVKCNPTTLSVTYSATSEMIEIVKQLKIKF